MGCKSSKSVQVENSTSNNQDNKQQQQQQSNGQPSQQPVQSDEQSNQPEEQQNVQQESSSPESELPTARQIQLVRETWEDVKLDMEGHGVVFYIKLFEISPETQELFPFRDSRGVDELKEDPRLRTQARRAMEMVGTAVDGLDDIPALVKILESLGARHVSYNVKEEYYKPVGMAMIYTLQAGLQDKFTPEVKEAWIAVNKVIGGNMRNGAREAQRAA